MANTAKPQICPNCGKVRFKREVSNFSVCPICGKYEYNYHTKKIEPYRSRGYLLDCLICGKKLKGKQTVFCSHRCLNLYHNPKRPRRSKIIHCEYCGKLLKKRRKKFCDEKCKKKRYKQILGTAYSKFYIQVNCPKASCQKLGYLVHAYHNTIRNPWVYDRPTGWYIWHFRMVNKKGILKKQIVSCYFSEGDPSILSLIP
jgi:predicted nucleic acid-binding Zn ribbon protein